MNDSLRSIFKTNKPFFPNVTNCEKNSPWCNNNGTFPVSGNNPAVAKCGSVATMDATRDSSGGISGRGVTPCPFGYLQRTLDNNKTELIPFEGKNFAINEPTSTLFDPSRPGFLPPQGNVRPLSRIGYEWRN